MSGTGPSDPESGKLFDSKTLENDKEFGVPVADLRPGEHSCYCTIHPYMVGKVTIRRRSECNMCLANSVYTGVYYVGPRE